MVWWLCGGNGSFGWVVVSVLCLVNLVGVVFIDWCVLGDIDISLLVIGMVVLIVLVVVVVFWLVIIVWLLVLLLVWFVFNLVVCVWCMW